MAQAQHIQNIWELITSAKSFTDWWWWWRWRWRRWSAVEDKVTKSFLNPLLPRAQQKVPFFFSLPSNWSHVCSCFQLSEGLWEDYQRREQRHGKKDGSGRWGIRQQWAGATLKADELHKTPHSRKSNIHSRCCEFLVLNSVLFVSSLLSVWTLKGRTVTDDVLAPTREELHLPVPRVGVHYTGKGQRSEGTNVRWAFQLQRTRVTFSLSVCDFRRRSARVWGTVLTVIISTFSLNPHN